MGWFGKIVGGGLKLLTGGPAGLLGDAVGMISDSIKAKRNLKQAIELKKLDRIERLDTADVDWDTIQAQNSGSSWKDEFWTVILAIPLIAIFIPALQPHVIKGFQALEQDVPQWYIGFVATAIGAAFGYRKIVAPLLDRKDRQKK